MTANGTAIRSSENDLRATAEPTSLTENLAFAARCDATAGAWQPTPSGCRDSSAGTTGCAGRWLRNTRSARRARRTGRGFAYAAPESPGRHDDRLDLRHLRDAHRVVAVEVVLLDAAVLAPCIPEGTAPKARRRPRRRSGARSARDSPRGRGSIATTIRWTLILLPSLDRDLGERRHVAASHAGVRESAVTAGRRFLAPAALSATASSTASDFGWSFISLRRNSSASCAAACASSSMKHSRKIAFWLLFTARHRARRHVRIAHRMVDGQVRRCCTRATACPVAVAAHEHLVNPCRCRAPSARPRRVIDGPDKRISKAVRLPSASRPPVSFAFMTGW